MSGIQTLIAAPPPVPLPHRRLGRGPARRRGVPDAGLLEEHPLASESAGADSTKEAA